MFYEPLDCEALDYDPEAWRDEPEPEPDYDPADYDPGETDWGFMPACAACGCAEAGAAATIGAFVWTRCRDCGWEDFHPLPFDSTVTYDF